jgi:hypothetical protein
MHKGWRATTEEGRNRVGSVTVHTWDWDRIVPNLGSFLKEDDVLGHKLWGAQVVRRPHIPPGQFIFRDTQGKHLATGWWVDEEPEPVVEAPRPPPPMLVVTVAQKPLPARRDGVLIR